MNLELLLWASRVSAHPRFREIATTHADTTLANHLHPDGSSFHVVDYDPATGATRSRVTHQGAAGGSAWARGQAWGLFGYTMMFRETKNPACLAQAQKIAALILSHPRLPSDKILCWDFILMHTTGHKPNRSEIDVPINRGDDSFIEALYRSQAGLARK